MPSTPRSLGLIREDELPPPILSVNQPRATEGQTLQFVISLDNPSTETITVDYATANASATQPDDYTSVVGTATFAPGQTTFTVQVTTFNNAALEGPQILKLLLSNASANTFIDTPVGQGIIGDDESPPAEIEINSFYTDGFDLKIGYTVSPTAAPPGPFKIALFASPDGQTLGQQLQTATADHSPGSRVLNIIPTFSDLPEDYFLVAKVDANDSVLETNEGNNQRLFNGGSFLAREAASGKTVVHVHGLDETSFPDYASVKSTLFSTNPPVYGLVVTIDRLLPEAGATPPPYYDLTGNGRIDALDRDAVAYNLTHSATPYRNPIRPLDVTNSTNIAPSDALTIINFLNSYGNILLPPSAPTPFFSPAGNGPGAGLYLDVNGDNVLSEADAELVKAFLNSPAYQTYNGSSAIPPVFTPPDFPWRNDTLASDISGNGSVAANDAAILANLIPQGYGERHKYHADEVHIRTHGGNDVIKQTTKNLTTPLWVFSGPGHDRITAWDRQANADPNWQSQAPGGNDLLYGGEGNDIIFGGDGNDLIDGNAGDDTITGGSGDDFLYGAYGEDEISGSDGHDILYGGSGNDTMDGGDGDNQIYDGPGGFAGPDGPNQCLAPTGATAPDDCMGTSGPTDPDIDGNPFVVISQNNSGAEPTSENGTSYITFTVQLVNGVETVYVTWATSIEGDDDASPDMDFESATGSVTLSPEHPFQTVQVAILFDEESEGTETFHFHLSNITGNAELAGSALASIHDVPNGNSDDGDEESQNGAEVGRRVTALGSDKGEEFWEGDMVTFTASLSSPTPGANESFTWEIRHARLITRSGETIYSDWGPMPVAGAGQSATHTFSEPIIGQVRVKLTSSGTTSAKTINIRAKAAYPVNFRFTHAAPIGNQLFSYYSWSSSSGRMFDLDGVDMGEFTWATNRGHDRGIRGLPTEQISLPKPPFNTVMQDGEFLEISELAVLDGRCQDEQGNVIVISGVEKSFVAKQFYWYKINDGFNYFAETNFDQENWRIVGDPVGIQKIHSATITFSVLPHGAGGWKLRIDKGTEGVLEIPITNFPFQ
jgi:hypothetical protein